MGLFELVETLDREPLVVAYGMGVDSTSVLVEFARREIRPDLILFANVGGKHFGRKGCEKDETYAYLPVINRFLAIHGMPQVTVVQYTPRNFKNWPPYYTLEENCLTNGTLPSVAFGFGSCSQKWKADPQHKYLMKWAPARYAWATGRKVRKVVGYDCGPRDVQRQHIAANCKKQAHLYDFWYPLQEWGWDRAECIRQIEAAGIPAPPKSSCFFCTAMKPHEVAALPKDKLRRIVIMEARAAPRLTTVKGLWRSPVKKNNRPGSMTEFIRREGLLPEAEIDRLIAETPQEIERYQEAFRARKKVTSFDVFVDQLVRPRKKAAQIARHETENPLRSVPVGQDQRRYLSRNRMPEQPEDLGERAVGQISGMPRVRLRRSRGRNLQLFGTGGSVGHGTV